MVDKNEILKAKEILGDKNADMIAELLSLEKYNEVRKVACCPSHNDSNPSFSYNPKTYSFYCFACGYSVDIIDAFMIKNKCTFIDACEMLFEEAGIPHSFNEKGVHTEKQYQYPKPVYADNNNKISKYLNFRGISNKTIDYLDIREDKEGNILFQYYDLNDVLNTVKVRPSYKVKRGNAKTWVLKDKNGNPYSSSFILYNMNKINTSAPLIITTGEIDCATCIEAGFINTVSVPFGDKNTQWISECWKWLEQFDEIILIHDNDESGEAYLKDVSRRLGEYRIKTVEIPKVFEDFDGEKKRIKDINELLYYEGVEAVKDAINNAKDSDIQAIVDYTDVKRFDMSDVDGFTTSFNELDRALGKFYMGTTTVITGTAGSGKSSLLSTLICQSVEQGFNTFIYSGELSNPSLKSWIDFVHVGQRGLNRIDTNDNSYYKIKPEYFSAINKYYKGTTFFYRDSFTHKISSIMETMESVVRKYGVKTIIVDNMSSLDLESNDTNKWNKQEEFIRELIEFSKKWNVAVVIVLHPKKMDTNRRMTLFDMQGVTACVNLAHRVLSLYRVSPKDKKGTKGRNDKWITPPIKYDVLLDVLKDRFGSAANKTVGLYYDIPSKRFFDTEKNLNFQYGFDKTNYGNSPLPFPPPQLHIEDEVFGGNDNG